MATEPLSSGWNKKDRRGLKMMGWMGLGVVNEVERYLRGAPKTTHA